MQDQQVDLVDAELAGALVERVQGLVVAVVADPDLGLDEHLVAVEPGARGWPRRPRARCRRRRRCRCAGSRCSSAASTAARVSSGGVWKTPSPRAGISTPLFSFRWSMSSSPCFVCGSVASPSTLCRSGAALGGPAIPPLWGESVRAAGRAASLAYAARCARPDRHTPDRPQGQFRGWQELGRRGAPSTVRPRPRRRCPGQRPAHDAEGGRPARGREHRSHRAGRALRPGPRLPRRVGGHPVRRPLRRHASTAPARPDQPGPTSTTWTSPWTSPWLGTKPDLRHGTSLRTTWARGTAPATWFRDSGRWWLLRQGDDGDGRSHRALKRADKG